MRQNFIIMGLCVAALAGTAHAQSTVGDALKNKPGSVGLQDADANSSSANRKAAPTAPKTSDKVRPVPGREAAPLGSTANRAGRDKAAADDTSGHGTQRTDSRKSSNGKDTTGNSNL